ncbi:MAG: hypothetical protein Ct9H90mP23_1460 [Methanobacteriota archaeon]|nr:MAG: hypothetical protein Ct9H90mP23_1460 [Euryarchaeota archaeon]
MEFPLERKKLTWAKASDTRAVIFEDVHVPVENLIGELKEGWFNAMKAFDLHDLMWRSSSWMFSSRLRICSTIADERQTFGKKLHEHQAIQFMWLI